MNTQLLVSDINSLTGRQMYDVCRLRQDVFTIEQNCWVPELDDTDLVATHILLYEDNILASYARVYKDDNEGHIKIGRVVTAKAFRGKSLGSDVIRKSIQVAQDKYNAQEVWLDAQVQAIPFYEKCGLKVMSDPFMEDGIQHVKMVFK